MGSNTRSMRARMLIYLAERDKRERAWKISTPCSSVAEHDKNTENKFNARRHRRHRSKLGQQAANLRILLILHSSFSSNLLNLQQPVTCQR